MLESFKLKEAWTYLFKEKQWGLKVLITILPGLIAGIIAAPVFFIATLLVFSADAKIQPDVFQTAGIVGSVLLLCLCCVFAVYTIVQSIISYWYQYEYTQIVLEKRESDLITKGNKMEVIKKAGKLFLVNIIYNIPTSLVLGFFYALFIVTGGVRQTYLATGIKAATTTPTAVGILLLCIVMFIAIFVVVPYNFYIVQTAKVRLIRTNTFREAFRIRTIIETVKKNFKRLSLFLGVMALYVLVYVIIMTGLSILGIIPFVSCCLIPFNIVITIAVAFFGIFVYPYMLGQVYKEIK